MNFLKLFLPVALFTLVPSTTQCMLAAGARKLATTPIVTRAASTNVGELLEQYARATDAATKKQTELIWQLLTARTEGEKAAIRYQMEKAQKSIACYAQQTANSYTNDHTL